MVLIRALPGDGRWLSRAVGFDRYLSGAGGINRLMSLFPNADRDVALQTVYTSKPTSNMSGSGIS